MKYCEYCGEENEKELVFCKKCGANLNYEAVEEHSTVKGNKAKEKTKKKVKKVTKKKKTRGKKAKNRDQEVVRKMSFGQKCLMFLMVVIIIILIGVIGGFIYVHYNGIPTTVPNVVGMTYDEAVEVLSEAKLKVTKVNQLTEQTDEVGMVLGQSPKSGTKTIEQARIKLEVGVEDDRYLVPNFVGMKASTAIEILKEAGVTYKITAYHSNHTSGMTDGVVETQSIKVGKKMDRNETITLSISEVVEESTPTIEPTATPEETPDTEENLE